ncbi:MAG: hypothetical protein JXR39_11130 [Marinilabiliaceae bacterium]|nr:hypothetical protein [Marinilabiliaceae bacterium]
MNKHWHICAILLLMALYTSCTKEDLDNDSPYVYNTQSSIMYGNQSATFKEILFYIQPYLMIDGVKKYPATDSLLNITMKVNRLTWGSVPSLPIDTTIFDLETVKNFRVTNVPIKYPVVASYQISNTTTTNAGHFADLLLNYQSLLAGDYLFRIESFDIRRADGTIKKCPTAASVPLTVKPDQRGSYIGEFEIEIKP